MYCNNCGNLIKDGSNFCSKCGKQINVNQNVSVQNNGVPVNSNNINRDELINAYIGNNSEKIRKGGFSFPTFLFGMEYVVYRKMYLFALIWFAIIFLLMFVLPTLSNVISLVGNIVLCIYFNKLYVKHAEEQVDNIIYNNAGKTNVELCDICRKKGGTSVIAVVILIILYLALNIYFLD